ncbi:hypothetical protein K474DRAFT_1348117 [Panus rudis PR-1116 ss-1]|nr:hypothetical protein K474DRAFT_1348117 [Panus rudis PR-1116 ss-1]
MQTDQAFVNATPVYAADSQIQYFGNWSQLIPISNSDLASSAKYTTTPGSGFNFSYTGRSIFVAGYVVATDNSTNGTLVQSVYTLDAFDPITFNTPNTSTDVPDLAFFVTNAVQDGKHKLQVNVTSCSDNSPFVFELVGYDPSDSANDTSTTAAGDMTKPSTSSTSLVSIPVTVPSGLSMDGFGGGLGASSTSKSPPIGAIVGGTVGGLVLLVSAAIALFFLCRKRKDKPYFYWAAEASELLDEELTQPRPYIPEDPSWAGAAATASPTSPIHPQSMVSQRDRDRRTSTRASASHNMERSSVRRSPTNSRHHTSESATLLLSRASTDASLPFASPNQRHSKAAEAGILSVPQPATFHADSGVRFSTMELVASGSGSRQVAPYPVDVPPSYSEN